MRLLIRNPLVTVLLLLSLCAPPIEAETPEMNERLPSYNIAEPEDVPVVIVGTILESASPADSFHPTRYDNNLHTRRYKVKSKLKMFLKVS